MYNLIFQIEKDKTKADIINEIQDQLKLLEDQELKVKIGNLIVDPILYYAIWDYSDTHDKYPCWLIIKSEKDDTGIIYSEYGFSFGNWGLVKLSDHPFHFGADYNWFSTLEEAFLNSWMNDKD